jgi:hypothetical protein
LRSPIITGLAAAAVVLGTWAAMPAANAAPATVGPQPVSASAAGRALATIPAGIQRALGLRALAPEASTGSSVEFGGLSGVACEHAGDCLGVGEHDNSNGTSIPTADLWSGSSWRATGLELPGGAIQGALLADSYKPGILMAVGQYTRGTHSYPVDNIWTGNKWGQGPHQPTIPAGESNAVLDSVSCASSTFCVASGYYSTAAGQGDDIPLAEVWNGSTWRSSRPEMPSSAVLAVADAVSCPSTTYCVVGGIYLASNGVQAWADSFDGAHWKALSLPQPQGSTPGEWFDEVSGVSCSSVTSCAIVGTYLGFSVSGGTAPSSTGFAETLNDGAWTVAAVRASGKNSELNEVDCLSSTFCVATGGIGSYIGPLDGEGDVALWNGSTWTPTAINPGTNIGSQLVGIDCAGTSYCVAVGARGKFSTLDGAATSAFYNGTSWAQHTAP